MVNRGGFSFVAMLVINPIVILFYQNCSMAPTSYANNTPPAINKREIASEAKATKLDLSKVGCVENKKECARAE